MRKELLLLGLGAAAVGVYILSTSGTSTAVSGNVDAAGSFPQYPQVGGSQYGGVSSPAGSISNPSGAGSNRPSVTNPAPPPVPVVSPNPSTPAASNYRSYLSDVYFQLNKTSGALVNTERNKLFASGPAARLVDSILSFNVPSASGGRATPEGAAGQFKLDDLFNTAQMLAIATQSKAGESLLRGLGREDAIGANISVDVLQRALYESLRNIGVR